jgi:hypothetical protein
VLSRRHQHRHLPRTPPPLRPQDRASRPRIPMTPTPSRKPTRARVLCHATSARSIPRSSPPPPLLRPPLPVRPISRGVHLGRASPSWFESGGEGYSPPTLCQVLPLLHPPSPSPSTGRIVDVSVSTWGASPGLQGRGEGPMLHAAAETMNELNFTSPVALSPSSPPPRPPPAPLGDDRLTLLAMGAGLLGSWVAGLPVSVLMATGTHSHTRCDSTALPDRRWHDTRLLHTCIGGWLNGGGRWRSGWRLGFNRVHH